MFVHSVDGAVTHIHVEFSVGRQRPAPQPARQDRHRDADAIPDADRQPFDNTQGTRTYRIEYTDDLTSNQWHPFTEPIPATASP